MAQAVASSQKIRLPVLEPKEILELASRRRATYYGRDSAYETYQRYYRGKQRGPEPSVMASNSQGRPLMRVIGESAGGERSYTSQRLAPVVDDAQALLGRMPETRVPPPDETEGAKAKAEKLTKFLISTHELSQMDRQQAEMGFHLPCLGDGCYLLEVDPDLRRVVWTVVDPSTAYPAFMWGYRRYDVLDLVIRYHVDAYAAVARWGYDSHDDKDTVAVTIYISPFQRSFIVGEEKPQRVAHIEWDLGFCPAVWVFNKLNGAFAQSDIGQSLVQQDALDFLWAVRLDGAVHLTYPIVGVKDAQNQGGEPIQVGPGAPPLALGKDGDIVVRNTQGDIGAISNMASSIQDELYAATGTSQVRQTGQMHSSIQTGRAMHASQGPQATRVELKQIELGAAIQRANSMTLEMQEKAPYLGDHEFEIFGRFRGRSFRDSFTPSKDIDGWYRNGVFWEPVTGMSLQQKVAIAYEGKAAGLWDSERASELVGEEDPMGMVKRVQDEKMREAQLQAQMQGALQGGGGAPPGAGGGEGQAPPPGAGGAPPMPGQQATPPPPQMIARPRGMMPEQGLPRGNPQGISLQAVEHALILVADKLKGTVAVLGQLAETGQGQRIQAVVSDSRDYSRVLPVLRALDPQAQVKQMSEESWPESAVRVA